MTARGGRNHKKKANRARSEARPIAPDDLPRPLRLVWEGQERIAAHVAGSSDRRSALARAEAKLDAAIDELTAVLAEFYPMDVAELVTLRNLSGNPETYRETDHEGIIAVVEIVALAAAAMPAPSAPLERVRHVPTGAVDAVQHFATEALEAASLKVLFDSAEDPSNPLAPLGFAALTREMSLRNTAYPHMLRDTLVGLFGDPEIEANLVAATGLTIKEILAFVDAADEVRHESWGLRLAFQQRITHLALGRSDDPKVQEQEQATLERLARAALQSAADAGTIISADLASRTGLSETKGLAFLELFGLDCSSLDAKGAVRDLLGGSSPLRTRPIVVDSTGRATACHSSLLVEAIRPRLEEALTAAGAGEPYFKHRGDFVEAEALRLVRDVLPSPEVHAGFDYFVPDPDAPSAEDGPGKTPDDYTKLVEGDGLVIVDDIAVIVESKAVNVSSGTRRGALGGIRRNLSRVVTDVVEQAHRMRTRIERDQGLRLRDGTWLDLSHIREVHSVAVTLEDLSGIATVTAHLVDAELVDPQALPWIVSLHDLRIITELVDRPSDLWFFLRRRTSPDVTRKFWAIDELDFFLHFLATGLYVEPDPDVVAADLPHLPPPTTAERRRYAQQGLEFLTSRTGPLDDWYFYRLGIRNTPADKPTATASPELLKLVDTVAASGKRGWPATAIAMLEGSYDERRALLSRVATVTELTGLDGRRHTIPSVMGTSAKTLTVLTMASGTGPLSAEDLTFFTAFTRAKKHQAKAARASTVIFDSSGEVLDLLYENDPYAPDPDLDHLVERLGLAPLVAAAPVPPKARARNKQREAERDKLALERRRRDNERSTRH